MALYLLPLGGTVDFQPELTTDSIITFTSASVDLRPSGTSPAAGSFVNLLNRAGDILLHISFRRNSDVIVLNTRRNGGEWQSEERLTLRGTFPGPYASITVYDHGDRYQILFDNRTAHYYKKRIPADTARVTYTIDQNITQVFSNPLVVKTFKNLREWVGPLGA